MLGAVDGSPIPVSDVLFDAVSAALRAARLTDGDVDPTVGEALISLGYDRDFAELVSRGSLSSQGSLPTAAIPGWRTVHVDVARSTIRLARGAKLDLGATAKALAADRAALAARRDAGCGVLVSFGGDVAIVGPPPADGWRVRVTDDHRAGVDAPGQWVSVRSGGLATSSVAARRWQTAAGVAHHLIDPLTGASVDSVWRTVSVTAASCLDANIASTAAIIRGARACHWLEELGLPSRLVGMDGAVRHVAGWPAAGDELPLSVAVPAGGTSA
jgi:thiamine biosynthesis lipoprotein